MILFYYYKTNTFQNNLNKITIYFFDVLAIIFVSILSSMQIFGVDDAALSPSHFNAYFYSVVQVYLGKALLVDFINQYGLYPHFIEPLFRIVELDVPKFTALMAILLGISFINIYIFLRNTIRNKLIFFGGFIMILFFNFLYLKNVTTDSYFQMYPHRLLFPTLLLVLSLFYFEKKNKCIYYLSFILYSISVLWNLETGIVVFFTWLLALIYSEFLQYDRKIALKNASKHLTNGCTILLLVFLAYSMWIYFSYGNFPNFYDFVKYQTYFGAFGFYMIPLKLVHPWNIVILIYMVGLSHSARYLITRENTLRAKMIFVVSILGAGIFTYYLGRSHDLNLLHIWYPAFILVIICADDLFNRIKCCARSRCLDLMELSIFAAICIIIISSNLSFLDSSHIVCDTIKLRQESIHNETPTIISNGIDFIKENTQPGEDVLILSYNTGIYHLGSLTKAPLNIPGFSELFLKSDYDKITNFLHNNTRKGNKVFLSKDLLTSGIPIDNTPIIDAILEDYSEVNRSEGGNIILYQKSHNTLNKRKFLLSESNGTILHYAHDVISFYIQNGDGPSSRILDLNDDFSLELIVKPSKTQVDYACIIGNHPGYNNYEGFVVQQDSQINNHYYYAFGNGKEWSSPIKFCLIGGEPNYLVIVVNKKEIDVYNNGLLLNSRGKNISMVNSLMPLYIGNWAGKDRPFAGVIDEIRITNRSLTKEEVQLSWRSIQNIIEE